MATPEISKTDMPVDHTEQLGHQDLNKPTGAASWDPEKRARVEKSMKRKLDARCALFVLSWSTLPESKVEVLEPIFTFLQFIL